MFSFRIAYFQSDGSQTAYAPRCLFTSLAAPLLFLPENKENSEGTYGPVDNSEPQDAKTSATSLSNHYEVRVKEDCDEEDPNADRVKNAWFLVRFVEVGCIKASFVQNLHQIKQDQINHADQVRQATDIVLKTSMRSVGMMAFGRSPKTFYFPQAI